MHGVRFTQDPGRGDMVHCGGRGYTALKNLFSMEGQGERVRSFVMHQVRSNIGGKAAHRKKQGACPSGRCPSILDMRVEGSMSQVRGRLAIASAQA